MIKKIICESKQWAVAILAMAGAAAALANSDPIAPVGFPNVPQTPGALLAGLLAPQQGRTAIIAYHNGILFSIPEAPSSQPGSDLQVRSWDISTPANLAAPVELAQWGVTPGPIQAHGYLKNGAYLSMGSNFPPDNPWSFRSLGNGVVREANPELLCAYARGCVFAPWFPDPSYSSYVGVGGLSHLYLGNLNVPLSEWDHLGDTGVIGYPFLLGNILIYASDQSRSGVATYDVSDPSNPVLLDILTNGGPGGYWPELWADGERLFVVFPYRSNGNGFRMVDATDPTDLRFVADVALPGDEAMYAKFQDEFGFIGSHKIDMRNLQSILYLDPDTAWSNTWGSGDGVSTSQFALPLGNLLVTGGSGPNQGMAIWAHQAEPDARGPAVAYHIPRAGQTNYPTNRLPVTLIIHETLESGTIINADTFIVRPLGGAAISGQLTWSFDNILTFTPDQPWLADTTYEVFLPGGGIKDAAGNGIEEYLFSFSSGNDLAGNQLPVIESIGAMPQPVAPNQPLNFLVSATDPEDQALEYRFDFGDGTPQSPWSSNPIANHVYTMSGHYQVLVQVRDPSMSLASSARVITVLLVGEDLSTHSAMLICDGSSRQVFGVNPDSNSIFSMNMDSLEKTWEVAVCKDPRSIAQAQSGSLWVSCFDDDRIQRRDATNGALQLDLQLAYGSGPIGMAISPNSNALYVTLQGAGRLIRIDADSGEETGSIDLTPSPRAVAVSGDGSRVYVTRLISSATQSMIWEVDTTGSLSLLRTLRQEKFFGDENDDSTAAGRGIANNLVGLSLSPDGQSLWFVANKANIERGMLFNVDLDQDNTVRNVLVQISLADGSILRAIDIDNSDSPSAVTFSPLGDYLLVTLQGNNQLAVFDALAPLPSAGLGGFVTRINTDLAPQGVCVDSSSGQTFVKNLTGRSLTALQTAELYAAGNISIPNQTIDTVANEVLAPAVLQGKRIFYNASDLRMSAEGYLSCATCHLDGLHDGRNWDFTGRGEGMRNTTSLRGRAGMGQGNVHWSANFDEIQDFEHDIRFAFGGVGFLSDAQFATANTPLGAPKAGLNPDLDALAIYLASLDAADLARSPFRNSDGSMTSQGAVGGLLFQSLSCADCHQGDSMTDSSILPVTLHDVGTLRTSSGSRLGGSLDGIDTPTLLGSWNSAPYFHDGSAPTLQDVFVVAGGQIIQGEDAAFSGGASSTGEFGWTWRDDTMKGRAGAQLSGLGHRITFSFNNSGAAGIGALEIRYSAGYAGIHELILDANGVQRSLFMPNTGNTPGWLSNHYQNIRFEDIDYLVGDNSFSLTGTTGTSMVVDEVLFTPPTQMLLAQAHRQVLDLSTMDREALMAFLRQLDGHEFDLSGADTIFAGGFEAQ